MVVLLFMQEKTHAWRGLCEGYKGLCRTYGLRFFLAGFPTKSVRKAPTRVNGTEAVQAGMPMYHSFRLPHTRSFLPASRESFAVPRKKERKPFPPLENNFLGNHIGDMECPTSRAVINPSIETRITVQAVPTTSPDIGSPP
jgi:hypothetical protein